MTYEDNLRFEMYNSTINHRADYLNNLKTKIGDTFKYKIVPCLEVCSQNILFNTTIIMYICPDDSNCGEQNMIHSLKDNRIIYNIGELKQFKVVGQNLFDDALEIFKSILIDKGFDIKVDEFNKYFKFKNIICNECQKKPEYQIHIDIQWGEKSTKK